jgi:acyl-coenzyme A thioesterase PaaI-like protein
MKIAVASGRSGLDNITVDTKTGPGKKKTGPAATTKSPSDLPRNCHPACFACGGQNGEGLGLRFTKEADNTVVGTFACETRYQGYPDRLHGGIVAMLVDAAMTHCLFVRGISAVTGKLKLRFPHPVNVGTDATIRASVVRATPPVFIVKAEISQEGTIRATAEGLFIAQRPDVEPNAEAHP